MRGIRWRDMFRERHSFSHGFLGRHKGRASILHLRSFLAFTKDKRPFFVRGVFAGFVTNNLKSMIIVKPFRGT